MDAVVGREEQLTHGGRQVDRIGSIGTRLNVRHQDGAGLGAVALPQFPAVDAVVGREKESAAVVCEFLRVEVASAKIEVRNRTRAEPVTRPQSSVVREK